jgi:putative acetyltransferase
MNAAINLADHWLSLPRLALLVYTDNHPVIGLFEKTGFAIEGTFRDFVLRNCDYANVHIMARLRPCPLY